MRKSQSTFPNWRTVRENGATKQQGAEIGRDEVIREIIEEYDEHLRKAFAAAERFVDLLESDLDLAVDQVFVGINSFNQFTGLFLLDKDKYESKDLLGAHRFAMAYEREVSESTFGMHFGFAPLTESLDESALFADGYQFKYELAAE